MTHYVLAVRCKGEGSFTADAHPDNDEINVVPSSTGTIDDLIRQGTPLKGCSISCDQAREWKSGLEGESWNWGLFGSNCWNFASGVANEMCNGCP